MRLQMQRRWWRKKQSEEESGLFDEVWDQRWAADGFAGSVAREAEFEGTEMKLAFWEEWAASPCPRKVIPEK